MQDDDAIENGFTPGEDLKSLNPWQKAIAVKCYLSSADQYPEDEKEVYEEYIQKQKTKLLEEFVKKDLSCLVAALLERVEIDPDLIEKTIELAKEKI